MIKNAAHLQKQTHQQLLVFRQQFAPKTVELSNDLLDECKYIKRVVMEILDDIQLHLNLGEIDLRSLQKYFSKSVIAFFESPNKDQSPYDVFLWRYDSLRNFLRTDFTKKSVQNTNTLDFIGLFNGYYGFTGALLGRKLDDFLPTYTFPIALVDTVILN